MIERLPLTAAIVLDAKYDVLAWNPLAAALLEDFSAQPRRERNMIRRYFLHPDRARRHYGISGGISGGVSGGGDFGRFAAGHLRAAVARYHVVLFTAEPGTPAHEALRLLSVIGLQRMS
jgi:hypothetical protein